MSEHFTATVQVTKTSTTPAQGTPPGRMHSPTPEKRTVHEVARITVRAETVEALREKVTAHVALIDGVVGDEVRGEATRS